jgi:phage-related protein
VAGTPLAEAFVRVRADTGRVRDDVRKEFRLAGGAAGTEFGGSFSRDASGRLRDERGRFVAEGRRLGDGAGGGFNSGFGSKMGELGGIASKVFDLITPRLSTVTSGFGAATSALGGVVAGMGKLAVSAGALSTLAAGAASAANGVLALGVALAPAAGAIAALPGVIGLGAAALATMKVAMLGVSDAFGAALGDDPKKYAEALEKLSPAARAVAEELHGLKPALDGIKNSVQDALFAPLQGQLTLLVQTLGGPLRDSMAGIASEVGKAGLQVSAFGRSAETVSAIRSIFADLRSSISDVTPALTPVLAGFRDIGVVGSGFLAGLAPSIGEAAARFGDFLSRAADSGKALEWMNGALEVFKALGGIAKDVVGILTGVFGAARDAGTGALGVLGQLVDKLNAWVNSARGQEVLVTVFKALNEVGQALVPVLSALGGAVAAIAPEAAKVATALGPVLADAITVLGKGIAAMGPGLVKMVEGFGRMVENIGPLEPLGAAIGDIFAALGEAFALIVPELAKIALALAPALANVLRALAPALAALGPGLVAIAENLAKAFASEPVRNGLLALGKGLSDILVAAAPLIPHLTRIAGILLQLAGEVLTNLGVALGPVIEALGNAMAPALDAISRALNVMLPYMEPIYKAFGDIGAALITELLPPLLDLIPTMIDSLIPAFILLAQELQPLLPLLKDLAITFIKDILPALLPMLPELSKLSLEFTRMGLVLAQLVADVAPYIERIIGIFQHLYDTLVGHSIIPDLINGMTKWFRDGVQWISDIVGWFGKLPAIIGAWLGQVLDWVQNKWNEIKNAIASKIDDIRTKIGGVLDSIKQKWSEIWEGLKTFVSTKWEEIKSAVGGKVDDMLGTIRGIPGRITSALGNLGSLLRDSGRSIIQGLIDGLYSKLQDAANAASDILNRIRQYFPFSPAKIGPFAGRGWTSYSGKSMMVALADGIRSQEGQLVAAANQVMQAGATAFAPALTRASPAPAFDGSFGVATSAAASSTGGTVHVENLVVNVQGILDPSNPSSYRRMVEDIEQALVGLKNERYQT